ncbi:hypothetical protein ACLB2K_010524 [Fragaria x ananassa]
MKSMNTLAILLLSLLLASTVAADDQSNVFDVTSSKYGGNPDSDITKALTMAWTDACESGSTSTVLVPTGTYKLLEQISFEGPCNAPIQFQLQGMLQAPEDRSQLDDSWVYFKTIDKLTLSGGGTFDGQGELSWKEDKHFHSTPVDVRFKTVNNSVISDITFMDSAKFHISVHASSNITFQRVTITAPEDSPNTDGIHIAGSSKITVSDSYIATGDDCVSIGDGATEILVSNITCGPGHGISIGSLGKYPDEQPVVGVTVKNCTLTGTTNGARIKTWPDSPAEGVAKDILYQDIIMVNVKNPILINQNYCDKGKKCKQMVPSKVQISDVRFKNIRGSSLSPVAVKLDCSQSMPCQNVELSDIDLAYSGDEKDEITSECSNVKPRITGVTKSLACANLRDIPIEGSPSPSTSPPLEPAPVQQSPPPAPVAKHHHPPPLSPPAEEAPPLPPSEETPPLPPVEETPPLPPAVETPPLPPAVGTPPKVTSHDPSPPPPSPYPYRRLGPTSSAAGNNNLWKKTIVRVPVLLLVFVIVLVSAVTALCCYCTKK